MTTKKYTHEKRTASMQWWNGLSFEEKFYYVIEWLNWKGVDTTSKHPNNLKPSEIQDIWTLNKSLL